MAGRITSATLEPGIARVTIDHQERLNAMNMAMWAAMAETMRALDADPDLRCIIITGAGERAFGAGADISEFEETRSSAAKAKAYAQRTHGALEAIKACRHPVVAAIRGLCVGGGLELATCADLRICGAGSRFGIPIKRLGLVVAYAEMRGLIELVGKSNALRILFEGDLYGAEEALRMGLVNRVVADGEVEAASLETARKIAEGAPLVARWHKKFANRLMDPRPLGEVENDESYACFDTEDFREGSSAFLAKRKPAFQGR
jgi:enoyl-CoA hydratase/carnithine racemase